MHTTTCPSLYNLHNHKYSRMNTTTKLFIISVLVTLLIGISSAQTTSPNFKVAIIGDQGLGTNAVAVLNLIKNESVQMVLHQGDFEYTNNPTAWDNQISNILGADFPYFASIGNHDVKTWSGPEGYQQKLYQRLNKTPGANCTGDLGVKATCTYQGLFVILSGAGTMGSGHDTYIKNELANDSHVWRICSWHKNMNQMQVGTKGNDTGWAVYETCQEEGAIILTGHEHSYERTKTLINVSNQTVDPTWSDPFNVRVAQNATFVVVSGLGGKSIRSQSRCLPKTPPYGCKGEWASIYTSSQNAQYGALFCTFNVDGQPHKAQCYFKSINGSIPDNFTITSFMGIAASELSLTVTDPQNITYYTTTVPLQGTTNLPSNLSYSLDSGPNVPIVDSVQTFSLSLSDFSLAFHTVTVTAVDAANSSNADLVTIDFTVATDTTPPSVTITSPLNGSTVGGTITITANAVDNVGVTRVEFFVDSLLIGTDTAPLFNTIFDTMTVSDGEHNISAQAFDAMNNTATETISVIVNNTAPPMTGIVLEELRTGGAASATTASLSAPVTLANNQLYLLTVATKPNRLVQSVSGLGLTWTRIAQQCGARAQTGVDVWYAIGQPTGTGTVSVTFSSSTSGISLAVSRWSGIDINDPIGSVARANTKGGIIGPCSGGTDTASYSSVMNVESADSIVIGAVSHRHKLHTAGNGYTELVEIHHNSGGSASGLSLENKTAVTSSVTVDGTFDGIVDWSLVTVELKAQSAVVTSAFRLESLTPSYVTPPRKTPVPALFTTLELLLKLFSLITL